jgi:hypothetical protein
MVRSVSTVVVLGAAAVVIACGRSGVEPPPATQAASALDICPPPGGANEAIETARALGTPVAISRPPRVYAVAHGVNVELEEGASEWCGIAADVFHVVTSDEPLTVRPGEEIVVPNPLPGERIHEAGVSFVDTGKTAATPSAGRLVWPFGPSHRSSDARIDEKGVTFAAETEPGRYVVSFWLSFDPREDMFETPRRASYYALLVDVED